MNGSKKTKIAEAKKASLQCECLTLFHFRVIYADLDTLSLRSNRFFLSVEFFRFRFFFGIPSSAFSQNSSAMYGISMSLFVRWIDGARTAASDFLSQSGNKLLLLLSNGTEMPYRTYILFESVRSHRKMDRTTVVLLLFGLNL